ncbi:hypothetical protein NL676_008352 [Syzygium grande]|nr:hypothetical protein NL676_008352 [Syzygium grande]
MRANALSGVDGDGSNRPADEDREMQAFTASDAGEVAVAAVAIGGNAEADNGAGINMAGNAGEAAVAAMAIGGRAAEVDNGAGHDSANER